MNLYIPKTTGTYADTLEAIGTASLIEEISGCRTFIKDIGQTFEIISEKDIPSYNWSPPSPGFFYIWEKSKEKKKPYGQQVIDYEAEKQIAEGLKKYRQAHGKKREKLLGAIQDQGLEAPPEPHREYRMASILSSMRKGWNADRQLYHWLTEHPKEAMKWVQSRLSNVNLIDSPIELSNSQFFNPISGKGVHSSKTIARSPSSISDEIVDSFSEWMKFRGAYRALLPYRSGDDFKFFVIEPVDIGPTDLSRLRDQMIALNLWGGIRLDIEANLRLAELLIRHSDVMGGSIGLRRKRPNQIIKGLYQAYFKSLGTAAALMNNAFLPLPSWFVVETEEDANAYLVVISEQIGSYEGGQRKQGCLGSLDENRSGDVPILQQYRKWLTTGELMDLLDFHARFAVHAVERRGHNEWVKEFSTENLDILLKRGYEMKEIVENPGFLSVARAIRNSTIYALGLKNRDVHFGLAQKWKQKIKGGNAEFIAALAEFVQQYNWESEGIKEKTKKGVHVVKQEELDSLLDLISQHGAELVGMLLLAYGYARAPKMELEVAQVS